MPILDGYRATHMIRHHNPYSSLPGMQSVPIVAMTASAIQGDREKCQRAGMDDYLAKPVKGKVLEHMLVKWALKSKNEQDAGWNAQSTDHDSLCSDYDLPKEETPPSSTTFTLPIKDGPESRVIAANPHTPSAESEGDRGLRRAAAAEKAESLRNDKLLSAAGTDGETKTRPYQPSPSRLQHMTRSSLPKNDLTEENVSRFGRIQAAADANMPSTSEEAADTEHRASASSLLTMQDIGLEGSVSSSTRTTAGLLVPNGGAGADSGNEVVAGSMKGKRATVGRVDSSSSAKTLTPA